MRMIPFTAFRNLDGDGSVALLRNLNGGGSFTVFRNLNEDDSFTAFRNLDGDGSVALLRNSSGGGGKIKSLLLNFYGCFYRILWETSRLLWGSLRNSYELKVRDLRNVSQ
jgi:hypothetical protein